MNLLDYEKELNAAQQDIIHNANGPALILAGPGSGKTRTIIYKICKLIEDGADPKSILLLTFTNKAAREMKNRIEKLIGNSGRIITAGTFHHFAHTLLRSHAIQAGFTHRFTILDDQDSTLIIKHCMKKTPKKIKPAEIHYIISLSKLRMSTIAETIAHFGFSKLKEEIVYIENIARDYEKAKKETNCVDFDDLLWYTHILLKNEAIREEYRNRFMHIFIDEFQDTDLLQAKILSLLYDEKRTKHFIVVGDEAQSIYSFRGTTIKNILEFKETYHAKIFYLLKNYRSTKPIIDIVNASIEKSKETFGKKIEALQSHGIIPILLETQDHKEEAYCIAQKIEESIKEKETIAVLFRSAYHASELEIELTRRRIPYELRGGIRFAEQQHIKDLNALVRIFVNKKDISASERLLRLFPRIGEKTALRYAEQIAQGIHEKFSDSIQSMQEIPAFLKTLTPKNAAQLLSDFYELFYAKYMKETFEDYEERRGDIETLIGAASQYETMEEFLASCILEPPEKAETKSIILTTIHQAKGLEWDRVCVMGLAEGMFPSEKATYLEEERRLFYVAISRAKKQLYLSYPKISGRFYDWREASPSRFIQELPEHTYQKEKKHASFFVTADELMQVSKKI